MANEPLQGLPVAVGSVTVSVYPCTGDCSAAVMAFVQELTAGSATPEMQSRLPTQRDRHCHHSRRRCAEPRRDDLASASASGTSTPTTVGIGSTAVMPESQLPDIDLRSAGGDAPHPGDGDGASSCAPMRTHYRLGHHRPADAEW